MTDNKTEHRGDMGKVAKDREKAPEAEQKSSQRTQGGHQQTQPARAARRARSGLKFRFRSREGAQGR